jgi:hypothetical protein
MAQEGVGTPGIIRHYQRDKTHCKYGHEFSVPNTYYRPHDGARICRACNNARQNLRYRNKILRQEK